METEQEELCEALMSGYKYVEEFINKECAKYLFKLINEYLTNEQKKEILKKYNEKFNEELKNIF